jgi:hypothetical protein
MKEHFTSSPFTSFYILSNVNTTLLNEGHVPQQEKLVPPTFSRLRCEHVNHGEVCYLGKHVCSVLLP